MDMAVVTGVVVATKKIDTMEGKKINIIQPVEADLKPKGKPLIALDSTGLAGRGEFVFYCRSRDAAEAFKEDIPTDATIVGIIDSLEAKK